MNQSNIFKKIGHILNELQDQYQFLSENPEQLSELELELFLANANFLSDHVEIVRKLNNAKLPVQELPAPEIKAELPAPAAEYQEEPVIEQIEREELQQAELIVEAPQHAEPEEEALKFEFIINDQPVSDKFDFEEKPVGEIFDRPLSPEEQQIIARKQQLRDSQTNVFEQKEEPIAVPYIAPVKTEPVPDKIEQKIVQPSPPVFVADKVEEKVVKVEEPQITSRPTLNDLLAGKHSNSYNTASEENSKAPIADLKKAINLNEKLLYIKDLFNGYNLAYSEAIDLINKMPDLKTADAFLKNNYAEKNNWQAKQTTVDKFYELLNQRFPQG